MTSTEYMNSFASDASESTTDTSLNCGERAAHHHRQNMSIEMVIHNQTWVRPDRETDCREDVPRQNPKRMTGIHRDIRATSTDSEELYVPAPQFDDPDEELPGESENPQRDFDDDIIEDAYED